MTFQLHYEDWKKIFPKAPPEIIKTFASDAYWLDNAGITHNKSRLAYTLANVEHECGGFTVHNLTENINYSAKRMAQVWPNRFSSAEKVEARYGTAKGWQKKAFNEIYGSRMGNVPGTDDGSRFIGRGAPQITGRDGYLKVGSICNLDLVNDPELATKPEHQPAILAAFFIWKALSKPADKEDFYGFVKSWNGGANGLSDRVAYLKGNNPIIEKLKLLPKFNLAISKHLDRHLGLPLKTPRENQRDSSFSFKLISICEAEYKKFGNGTLKEYEDEVYKRVGHYWLELAKTEQYKSWSGYNGKSGVKFSSSGKILSNKNQPWSAAFISFVMREAGAGSSFSYAPSHSVYIVKALEAAKKATSKELFVARRHKSYSPKLGDLIACERQPKVNPNFDTYKAYASAGKYEAHCDIVTEVHSSHLITIGGNVSNSVSKKKWALDENKMIENFDPKDPTASVICVIENRL